MKLGQAVSTRINEYLRERGMTQKELAEKSQISYYTLKSLMCNADNGANVLTLICICRALNITISEFLDTPLFCEYYLDL